MAEDRPVDADNAPSADGLSRPKKRPYVAPTVLHYGTFNDLTQTNRHSRRSDSRRSDGTN